LAKARLAMEDLDIGTSTSPTRKLGVDRFHVPAAFVLGFLVLESLIGTRKRLRR
jgi:hypothetical protein